MTLLQNFKKFLLRGNVVDLAVAVVVGAAFTAVVNAVVRDILTPLIAAIVGQHSFQRMHFTIHHSVFNYGDLLNSLISFLAIAAIVFFFVVTPINSLLSRRHQDDPDTKPCPQCTSAIPVRARRCPLCTSEIAEAPSPA